MSEDDEWMDCNDEEWTQGENLAAPIKKLEVGTRI